MATPQIMSDRPQKRTKTQSVERTPPCQYATVEEFRAAVSEGMEDIRAGRTVSHEEIKKRIATWLSR
jgi:predicted transcriptional regulator